MTVHYFQIHRLVICRRFDYLLRCTAGILLTSDNFYFPLASRKAIVRIQHPELYNDRFTISNICILKLRSLYRIVHVSAKVYGIVSSFV